MLKLSKYERKHIWPANPDEPTTETSTFDIDDIVVAIIKVITQHTRVKKVLHFVC